MNSFPPGKGPPLFGLPLGGVVLGLLWSAAAFGALFFCFIINYIKTPINPGRELAIANVAMAHHAEPARAPQP